jgi:nitroimidazol reductase NimA-like FMN-containing flavoprotein (pyridoxamine 5'-phosphate oxidase superfamily)
MLTTSGNGSIDRQRCIELLRGVQVGRIAWRAADGIHILPVTFIWYENTVVFRTSPYGVLSELVHEADVAFEIDHVDEQTHSGWSVVVRGRARATAEPEELRRLWRLDDPVPWAAGTRNLFIQITPSLITGRRVGPQPLPET